MEKSQLVVIPNPDISHLPSTVEFTKLLINHDHRLSITILIIAPPSDATVDTYINSSNSSIRKRLQIILLPTPSQYNITPSLDTTIQLSKRHVRQAVSDLITTSDPDSPRLAGFIVDMFSTAMIDVADEFGIPSMVFFTSGAAALGGLLHVHTLRERDGVDTTSSEFKYSGKDLNIETFANPVPLSVVPSFSLEEEWKSFFWNYGRGLKRAKGFIVNTCEELESYAIRSFFKSGIIKVYPVGPILGLKADSENDNSVQQKSEIIEWLDNQPPSSVIFLCFGSKGVFDEEQVREMAYAIEKSGVRFLWSLRKPPPKDTNAQESNNSVDLEDILPKGFLERTAGIGRVIGWAPQTQILAHQATGGFVSHCGWNSVLESIYFGVPIVTWPLHAEQQMNAFELVRELNMAVEIVLDYNMEYNFGTTFVSAEKIEKGIKEVMKEDNEVKKKVKQISEICRKTLTDSGSSYYHLGRLIDDITKMELK